MNPVAARNEVNYEVYVKDQSGRWQIHAHFSRAQRKQAEEEAKQLEQTKHVIAVKVIREVYDHQTNSSDDYVIYETRGAAKNPSPSKPDNAPKTGPGSRATRKVGSAPQFARSPCAPENTKPSSATQENISTISRSGIPITSGVIGLVIKLLIAFCIALALGLATMLLAAKGLEYLPEMGLNISRDFYDKANFICFTVGFLATAVPMLMRLTKNFNTQPHAKSDHSKSRQSPARSSTAQRNRPVFGDDPAPTPPPRRTKTAAELAAEILTEETGQHVTADQVEGRPKSDQTNEIDTPPLTPDRPSTDTTAMQETRQRMKGFISGSIEAIKRNIQELDAYHKFGVNLYVAGACDACGEQNALDIKASRTVLRDCISALGANNSMAETFCKNVDNYILEPKYKDMYGAGRQSMSDYTKDENSISSSVSHAITSWGDRATSTTTSSAKKNIHALMFTDIVNSTAKTQELGDHGAQQLVHIHNQIVRTALINNYGKEVKHLGDGIMAVFPSSANAVHAALEIQQNMVTHNANQDLKFQIRIGINAGEALAEENDLFGSVVQLAARICAQAEGDQSMVSENVKNTYSGNRVQFVSVGERQMKGFSDPIEVFVVQSR
ncbi:adenylate/guanylate cyclase domain-containing protein [Thalassospira sp. MA62]|nr:adenylate/guanylate cyclase domain-containing protein [Thalassospira sp. MA62]